jgi:hypothetical protein
MVRWYAPSVKAERWLSALVELCIQPRSSFERARDLVLKKFRFRSGFLKATRRTTAHIPYHQLSSDLFITLLEEQGTDDDQGLNRMLPELPLPNLL